MKYLAEKLKIRQSGYQDWITVRAPSLTKPGFFRISADSRIPVYPADRNQFIINVGNAPDVKSQENKGNQSSRAKIRSTRLNQPDRSYEGSGHG